ncbi:MAG: transposase [Chlamydiales bacterium]|nr:transposase [Chlamydiales bacterium]
MKIRKWSPKTKAKIVLDGLKGRKIADICNEHQISQSQYYQWRDQFVSNLDKPFETKQINNREERLKKQVNDLKSLVGDLTLELKKIEEEEL